MYERGIIEEIKRNESEKEILGEVLDRLNKLGVKRFKSSDKELFIITEDIWNTQELKDIYVKAEQAFIVKEVLRDSIIAFALNNTEYIDECQDFLGERFVKDFDSQKVKDLVRRMKQEGIQIKSSYGKDVEGRIIGKSYTLNVLAEDMREPDRFNIIKNFIKNTDVRCALVGRYAMELVERLEGQDSTKEITEKSRDIKKLNAFE